MGGGRGRWEVDKLVGGGMWEVGGGKVVNYTHTGEKPKLLISRWPS